MKFRTYYTQNEKDYETISDEIIVEPSMAYTIRETVKRISSGLSVPGSQENLDYPDEDQTFDDVDPTSSGDFDMVDAKRMSEDIEDRIQQSLKKSKDEKKKAKQIEEEKLKNDLDELERLRKLNQISPE